MSVATGDYSEEGIKMADGFTTDEVTDVIEKAITKKVLGDKFYKSLTTSPRDLAEYIKNDLMKEFIIGRNS